MLDRPVRIIQLRADRPDVRLLADTEQLLDPARTDYLDVIVQQDHILAAHLRYSPVVKRRIVKCGRIAQHAHRGLQLPVELLRCRLRAVIFHNHYLIIPIRRPLHNRADAPSQVLHMVFVRNHDRDKRRPFHRKPRPVPSEHGRALHLGPDPDPPVMRLDRTPSGFKRICLACRIARSRLRVCPPVIQHPWNMVNAARRLTAPQHKIIILRPVIRPVEQPNLLLDTPAHRKQVADIIVAAQQLHTEIRLEMRPKIRLPAAVHLVLVRVDHASLRVRLHCRRQLIDCVNRQHIIVIGKYQKIPIRHPDRSIRIVRDATVLFETAVFDPRLLCIAAVNIPLYRVLAAPIRKAELNILISLIQNRIDHLSQELLRRIVQRNHNRKLQMLRKAARPLLLPLSTIRLLCANPYIVIRRRVVRQPVPPYLAHLRKAPQPGSFIDA